MTTKTIPEYIEDEHRKDADTQLRTEEEAARIQARCTMATTPHSESAQAGIAGSS